MGNAPTGLFLTSSGGEGGSLVQEPVSYTIGFLWTWLPQPFPIPFHYVAQTVCEQTVVLQFVHLCRPPHTKHSKLPQQGTRDEIARYLKSPDGRERLMLIVPHNDGQVSDASESIAEEFVVRCPKNLRISFALCLHALLFLQASHRSRAASGHARNWNSKPDCSSRPGVTRRLFSTSSVSVRRRKAPISSIQDVAGRPNEIPHACRSARINSAFGSGQGAETLIGPSTSSCAISQKTARTKSAS